MFGALNVKNTTVWTTFGRSDAASYHCVLRCFHSICLKYCACHEKVMPGHTKCCTCHAKSSSRNWRSDAPIQNATHLRKSPPLRPDLLAHLPHVSLVLRLPHEMHLSRSSSNVPHLPSFLKLPQNPHVLLTFDKVYNPLRLPRKTSALHSTFHFWRKSRRIASFWSCQLGKWRKSSRIVLVLTLSKSKIEEVSQNCCVFDAVKFKKLRKSRRIASFSSLQQIDRQLQLPGIPLHYHYITATTTLRYTTLITVHYHYHYNDNDNDTYNNNHHHHDYYYYYYYYYYHHHHYHYYYHYHYHYHYCFCCYYYYSSYYYYSYSSYYYYYCYYYYRYPYHYH